MVSILLMAAGVYSECIKAVSFKKLIVLFVGALVIFEASHIARNMPEGPWELC